MRLTYLWITLILLYVLSGSVIAGEYHDSARSVCSDCHVMHAVKDSQQFVVTESLLKHPGGEVGLCMSCHDGTNPGAPDIVSTGTSALPGSIISTPYTSKHGSSAGCFQGDYSVAASPFGHDLNASGSSTVPLSTTYTKPGGLKCSSCHNPHGTPNYRNLLSDPNPNNPGSVQMLLGTHVKETVAVNADTPNPAQAYDTGNVGWSTSNNITAWCADCHDQLATNTTGVSPAHFRGHPSDVAINSSGAHTDVNNWIAGSTSAGTGFGTDIGDGAGGIPRVRFGSPTSSPSVASAGDTVTCLTCHKAHGSKWDSGLNWPHKTNLADQYSSCQQCHYK